MIINDQKGMRFLTFLFLNLYSITLFSASLEDALGEIRAMAVARVQFNQSWATYLEHGHFGVAEDVVATPQERWIHYWEVFLKKSQGKTVGQPNLLMRELSERTKLFVDDIDLYRKIIKMIDDHKKSKHFADCLFSYLHALFCMAPEEKTNDRELAEFFWLSSMRNKLNPYVSSQTHYLKNLLKCGNGIMTFDVSFLRDESSTLSSNMNGIIELLRKTVKNKTLHHTVECLVLLRDTVNSRIGTLNTNPYTNFLQRTWKPFAEDVAKFPNYLRNLVTKDPIVFQLWFSNKLSPLLAQAETDDLEGKRCNSIINEVEDVLKRFENNCCETWIEHLESLKKPQPKKGRKALTQEKVEVPQAEELLLENRSKAAATAATQSAAAPYFPSVAIPDNGAAAEAASCAATPTMVAHLSSGDTNDSLAFEPFDLSDDLSENDDDDDNATSAAEPVTGGGDGAAATTEPVTHTRIPEAFRNHKCVQMIFETHGPVDYDKFERQLTRDFRGHLFQPRQQRGSILRELRINVSANKVARACALYHSPHGAQDLKKWPQWRIAYKNMFEDLARAFPMVAG